MARKVFISFLGVVDYIPSCYFDALNPQNETEQIRFVQEATLSFYCKDFNKENDKVLFFVTNEAEINWKDHGHTSKAKYHQPTEGVCTRLKNKGFNPEEIRIPSGKNAAEIWDIFDKVYTHLEAGDEIIFDITHALRSIPMLFMVLLDYARVMKEIKVLGIYYGAFEAKFEAKDGQERTPVWNLKTFADLQEWSSAADSFIHTGQSTKLKTLFGNLEFKELAEKLETVSNSFQTVQGKAIYDGAIFADLHKEIQNAKQNADSLPQPFMELLDKIASKTKSFSQARDIKNGFAAVAWCLDHDLIQQGVTILQETIITYVLDKTGYAKKPTIMRSVVSGALSISNIRDYKLKIDDKPHNKKLKEDEENLRDKIYAMNNKGDLTNLYEKITNLRNAINHANIVKPIASEKFKSELSQHLNTLKTLLNINF